MVEHHHGPVLDIVKPPLGRQEPVLTELGPDGPVVAVGGDGVGVGDGRVHTEMLWQVALQTSLVSQLGSVFLLTLGRSSHSSRGARPVGRRGVVGW